MIERTEYKKAGHKRLLTPSGNKEYKESKFSGGWNLACTCGWKYLSFIGTRKEAIKIFSGHVNDSSPICHGCEEEKADAEMSECNRLLCKKCVTERSRVWGANHKSKWERQKRKSNLKKKYGLSIEQYEEIIKSQGGVCAICGGSLYDSRGYRPHVDHDHITGKVRGVLCINCNNALGRWKDDKNKLIKAYNYLLKHETDIQNL